MNTDLSQGPPTSNDNLAVTGGITEAAAATAPTGPTPDPPAPAPAAAAPQPSLWRSVVQGALQGLAGSAGAKSFGAGLAGGAGGVLEAQQRAKVNARADQDQANQNQQQMDAHTKAAVDVAHTQANIALLQRQTMDLPENHQQTILEGRARQTEDLRAKGFLIPAGSADSSPDHHVALQQVSALTAAHPGRLFTAEPIQGTDGKFTFQPMESTDSLVTEDLPIKDISGKVLGTIPKNTVSAKQATALQINALGQGVADLGAKAQTDRIKANAAMVKAGAAKTAADKKASDNIGDWKPKTTADQKKKADLAENIAVNAEEVAKILQRRPDIVGAVAGRYTSVEQMVGNNDADISSLATHIHNIAMANSGVHGFRSHEGVRDNEKTLLNNFKNGPRAVGGALKASVDSVQTFVDAARPETYKTHSKMGGVLKGVGQ